MKLLLNYERLDFLNKSKNTFKLRLCQATPYSVKLLFQSNGQKWKMNCWKLREIGKTNGKIWQKPSKNCRKQARTEKLEKCEVCPGKLPFLSCQAPFSVLPSSHFCPGKLTTNYLSSAKLSKKVSTFAGVSSATYFIITNVFSLYEPSDYPVM